MSSTSAQYKTRYQPALHDFIGLVVEKDGSDGTESRIVLPLGEAVRGAVAPLHGGMIATMVDVACAAAIGRGSYDIETTVPVSTDLTVRFFRQPKSSPLTARGRIVNRSSRLISAECDVTDAEGRLLARGTGSYLLVTGFTGHGQSSPAGASIT